MPDNNPLLQQWDLPLWSAVRAENLVPAITAIIADNRQTLDGIIASQTDNPNWDDLVLAVDETDARLEEAMAIIGVFSRLKTEENWNYAIAVCSVFVDDYKSWKASNRALFGAYQHLENSSIAGSFDGPRKATLAKILRKFRLSGIDLSVERQQELVQLNAKIASQEEKFLTNLDSADAQWNTRIDDESRLEGLPTTVKERAALLAKDAGHTGWLIPLDSNTYHSIMTYAKDRTLRETYFLAYSTRASDQGPHAGQFDNGPVLATLLNLRQQKAELLGFESFAHLKVTTETAESTAQISQFLQRQITLAAPTFAADAAELKSFALEQGLTEVHAWDEEFLAEQFRNKRFDGALNDFRDYFALEGTLRRLCLFSERMFGIGIVEQTAFDRWHEHIRLFEISEHGQVIGHIYFDPFHRAEAVDFAGTVTLRNRRINAEGRPVLPIALLNSNFPAQTAGHPCLLEHKDLRVLFHEFGHCLQHILTRSPHHHLSGITQLGRATVEFAGQVFEQWCLSREFLLWLAAHHQTGARFTHAQVDSALAALKTQASRPTAILLMGALLDYQLHSSHGDGRNVQQVFDDVQRKFPHLQLPAFCRFANGFDYMVTGYGASFYAYKWSGVLATEAFKRFQEDWVFNPQTGRAFREAFFSPGDSRSLLVALEAFLQRPLADVLFSV